MRFIGASFITCTTACEKTWRSSVTSCATSKHRTAITLTTARRNTWKTFGFHLVSLDLRQESTRHSDTVAEILQLSDGHSYGKLDEGKRLALLSEAIEANRRPEFDRSRLSQESREVLEVFDTIGEMRAQIGRRCIGSYVISMTHSASHIMEVIYLGFVTGLVERLDDDYHCELEVAPLFETIDDLGRIDIVLDNLLQNPVYKALLQKSGGTQEVMLGYSDSCKDGGIMSAAWGLYQAQQKVVQISTHHAINCRIFHGRGGTITRGGGPTHEAIMSQPPHTVLGQIKFTEQGEVLSHKYGNAETAIYELAMGITGLMKASMGTLLENRENYDEFHAPMQQLSD